MLVWRYCIRRLQANNAIAMSAALSYQTIFALIPSIVIAFLVLKAGGAVENSKKGLRQLLHSAGLSQISIQAADGEADTRPDAEPADTVNLADRIEALVESVERKLTFARLGPVGLILLAWAAVTLLTTMEHSLNRIFEAPRSRPLAMRVLLYWSAVTFLPIVLAAAGWMTTVAMETARHTRGINAVLILVDVFGSLAVGTLMLALVYKFMPNTHVRLRSALIGAAMILPLWILARWGFGLYLSRVVAKGSLYGALGLLPLFLLWINLCWYLFLLGAQFAHTAAHVHRMVADEQSEGIILGPMDMLAAALVVARAFADQRGPTDFSRIAEGAGLPDHLARRLVDRLIDARVLCPLLDEKRDAYVPARPLESIRVNDVLSLADGERSTGSGEGSEGSASPALRTVRDRVQGATASLTLADLAAEGNA